jgi:hypothetical protein
MISLIGFLLAVVLSLACDAFCIVEQVKMKMVDASEKDSPVTVSGEVLFTDAQAGPTPYSFQATASATNVSGRDMLLVVVSFEVTGTQKFDIHNRISKTISFPRMLFNQVIPWSSNPFLAGTASRLDAPKPNKLFGEGWKFVILRLCTDEYGLKLI